MLSGLKSRTSFLSSLSFSACLSLSFKCQCQILYITQACTDSLSLSLSLSHSTATHSIAHGKPVRVHEKKSERDRYINKKSGQKRCFLNSLWWSLHGCLAARYFFPCSTLSLLPTPKSDMLAHCCHTQTAAESGHTFTQQPVVVVTVVYHSCK